MKKKDNKLYVKCKGYDSSFKSLIDKKDIIQMSEYLKPKYLGGKVEVELDLLTKADLKNVAVVDTSKLAKKQFSKLKM